MRFTQLRLKNFRNYDNLEFRPHSGTTVLYGANGSGKTNLLEAIHLLCLGRSHRTTNDKEMVQASKEVAVIRGETKRRDGFHDVEVRLHPFQKPNKRVMLYGKPARRIGDMMGHATVVMFSPEDLRIIQESPATRRRFMDMQLSQIRPRYFFELKQYLHILENRNALLKKQKIEGVDDFLGQLETWDEQLSRVAVNIVKSRKWFLDTLSLHAANQYNNIASHTAEEFTVRYEGVLANAEDPYQCMMEGLKNHRREEMQRMYTVFGPHRDDMTFYLSGNPFRSFGSQGQLRTAVLSLKLGEIQLIKDEMGEPPTLLLDDVFSELDAKRRNSLLSSVQEVQTILTCTDKQDAAGADADEFIRVSHNEEGKAFIG